MVCLAGCGFRCFARVGSLEIKKIIDWLEQLWLDEETQKLIDEDTWLKFIGALKEEL